MAGKQFVDRLVFFFLWVIVSALGWPAGVVDLTSMHKLTWKLPTGPGLPVGRSSCRFRDRHWSSVDIATDHSKTISMVLEYASRIHACVSGWDFN